MSKREQVVQDTREMDVIFIRSTVDDAGLTPAEFRVYGHLARRAGGSGAYPGIDSMCRICQLAKNTVISAIRELERRGMLKVVRATGACNKYVITRQSEWTVTLNEPVQTKERTSSNKVTHQFISGNERESIEGNPIKEANGAFALVGDEQQEIKTPKGSKKFIPPQHKEVEAYMLSIGFQPVAATRESQRFIDYHEQGGWMMARGKKMACWKAAVRTWKHNYDERSPQTASQPAPKKDEEPARYQEFIKGYPDQNFASKFARWSASADPSLEGIRLKFYRWERTGKYA